MYHISLYFDEKTTAHMHRLIEKVALAAGNFYMLEANVPPHITLCALECEDKEALRERLENLAGELTQGTLQWVSVGTFLPGVIFVQPVLNEYLQGLMERLHACVQGFPERAKGYRHGSLEPEPGCMNELPGIKLKPCYKPFSWLPHSTVAKKLTPQQLTVAFEVLQKEFSVFEGQAVRIGLAKMNPHREIASWELHGESQ